MDDREKLIELIIEAKELWEGGTNNIDARIADHLLANGVTVQNWIPITERLPEELPKDCSVWSEQCRPSVDVLVKRKRLKQYITAWYSYAHKFWVNVEEEHCFADVTHWMPLPEPPKGV